MPEGGTVLVLNDEPRVLQVIRLILGRAGYVVLPARSSVEATRLVGDHPRSIDLLLIDGLLPEAQELAQRFAAVQPGVKVIFMSAHAERGRLNENNSSASVRFLQKPFSPQALTQTVRELLDPA